MFHHYREHSLAQAGIHHFFAMIGRSRAVLLIITLSWRVIFVANNNSISAVWCCRQVLAVYRAPKARNAIAWANGPGWQSRRLASAEGAKCVCRRIYVALQGSNEILFNVARGVAPGYYISRLQREESSPQIPGVNPEPSLTVGLVPFASVPCSR